MRCYGAGLAVIVASCVLVVALKPDQARAQGAQALAAAHGLSATLGVAPLSRPVLHRHRKQTFYCYPRNYWWFYRPYTTAPQGYPRCMPYFHYLEPSYGRRGASPDQLVK